MPQIIAGVVAIVGAVAGAASTAAVGATLALGGSLATASIVGEALYVAVPAAIEFGALAGASALLAPRPHLNVRGSPQSTKYDPQAPIPCVMGRYGVGGNVIYRTTSGGASKAVHGAAGNEFLTEFNVLSGLGPIRSIDSLRFDDTVLVFEGETCKGGYIEAAYVQSYNPGYKLSTTPGRYENNTFVDHAWQNTQLGAVPSAGFAYPTKIADANDALIEWTAAMALSGFAASALTISYDVTVYAGGVPQKQWVIEGYPTWDPRLDSTWPGGSGPSRWADRTTWTWSQNPAIHALNYALGHFLSDGASGAPRRYAGIGAGLNGVDVSAFVAAANIADANGWIACGQWTTGDGKWSVLTAMLQAGGALPIDDRGRISCMASAPRTSLGVVTAADLAGDVTLDTGASMRERINTVYPSYTSEAHRWQIVQADTPVRAATYVAEDGGVVRSKALTFEYVPRVDQACQLAAYAICDGREIPAIVLVGKPHLRGYAVGDCLTLDVPEAGLGDVKVVVTKRSTAIATGVVTLTCRSETDAKHAYALGLSGVAPATPMISGYDPTIVPAPIPAAWAAAASVLTDASGAVTHVVSINGAAIDNVYATTVVVSYAPVTSVGGVDVDGPFRSQTYAASVQTIDLRLAPGRWHVTLHYILVSGAEAGADGVLDLGVFTVAADVAASAAGLPGTATIGDAGATVAATLAQLSQLATEIQQGSGGGGGSDALAQQAASDAEAARDAAQSAESAAQTSAGAAASSATAAGASASGAAGAASQANGAATAAGSSATSASGYANTASVLAGAAATSATGAATSASGAAAAQSAAGVSASAADTARVAAQAALAGAQGSASAAASSAATAAGSVTAAGQSASAAQTSATAAGTSESNAGTSASAASASRTGANGAANAASGYAQVASASATNAATSEANASSAATAAANSAGAAAQAVQSVGANVTIGPNLVPDGGLALSVAGAPGGWSFLTPGYSFAQATSYGNRIICIAGGPYNTASPFFPLDAGATYTLSARLTRYDAGGELSVRVIFCDAAQNELGSNGLSGDLPSPVDASVPGTLRQLTFTAPGGASCARVQITGVAANGTNHQVQAIKLEPGATATAFSDNATTFALAANVTQTSTAVATLAGQAYATYGVAVNAAGHVAGFKLVSANGAAPVSAFEVDASNFVVVTPSGATLSFDDAGGGTLNVQNLIVRNANIGGGAVGTNELGASAVTEFSFWLNSYSGGGYLWAHGASGGASTPAPTPPSATAPPTGGGGGARGAGTP